MSHLDPSCSSLGLRIGGLQDPLPQQSHPQVSYVLLGGDCPGLLGGDMSGGDVPGGFCPLTSMGYGCSLALGKDSPDWPRQSPAPHSGSARGRIGLSLPHCISWEGLVSPSLSMESLLRWAQLAGQLSRDLKDGHLLEGGL